MYKCRIIYNNSALFFACKSYVISLYVETRFSFKEENYILFVVLSRKQLRMYVVKKDGPKELFNVEKIVNAVNKSATRILYTFSEDEIQYICKFAMEKANSLKKTEIDIQDMHNIVEGALEKVNPDVAQREWDLLDAKDD